jgi:hypothetical protein
LQDSKTHKAVPKNEEEEEEAKEVRSYCGRKKLAMKFNGVEMKMHKLKGWLWKV